MKRLFQSARVQTALTIAGVAAALYLTLAGLIWLAWNLVVPDLFGGHVMSYPEALGMGLFLTIAGAFTWAFKEDKSTHA